MKFGYRDRERFWITLIVRLAFGLLFLIAAVNIFTYYDKKGSAPEVEKKLAEYVKKEEPWLLKKDLMYIHMMLTPFAEDLSKPYESTWINFKWKWWPAPENKEAGTVIAEDLGIKGVWWFLYAMPFIFSLLAVCLLTGLFLRPAMRLSAIFLVLLGVGKYIAGDHVTTAQDFLYAAFLCIGLYMASEDKQIRSEEDAAEYEETRSA